MNTSITGHCAIALLAAASIALLAGCAETSTASPPAAASPASSPTTTSTGDPETTLQQGMTADTVRGIMGEPAEIKPMKSPSGKAEIWVYHRTTRGSVQQVQVGAPEMRQQIEFIDETISLLMLDDKYFQQKRTATTRLEYQ